jgi:ketosteroid isomerase-like protein
MAHPNDELIQRFYEAFDRHDGDTMAAAYTDDARFSDPVFPDLRGREPGAMWRMLTGRSKDLRVELAEHEADDTTGSAHWIAHYTYEGRPVVNDIRATFRFRDGKIAEHDDVFSFPRWARQALGPAGLLLGWTPLLRAAVRKKARQGLDAFLASGSPTA